LLKQISTNTIIAPNQKKNQWEYTQITILSLSENKPTSSHTPCYEINNMMKKDFIDVLSRKPKIKILNTNKYHIWQRYLVANTVSHVKDTVQKVACAR